MVHGLDYAFVSILVALFPLYNWNETRKAKRQIAEGTITFQYDNVADYKKANVILWAFCATCLVIWIRQTRQFDVLGLTEGTVSLLRWIGGAALALGGIALTFVQAVMMEKSDGGRKELQEQIGELAFFLPKTRSELHWFYVLSLSAGVCEEILYRGYLMWFIGSWTGTIAALFLSSIAFGIAHSYQGPANAARTAVIGLWMGTLYLITGSLWIPMATHFMVDVISGRMIYRALARPGD